MTNTLRLTLQVLALLTTRAAVIRARVELASRRPPIEDARPSCLKRVTAADHGPLPVFCGATTCDRYTNAWFRKRTLRTPHRILAHPVMVRRAPELPIRLTERRAPVKTVRDTNGCSIQASASRPTSGSQRRTPGQHHPPSPTARRRRVGADGAERLSPLRSHLITRDHPAILAQTRRSQPQLIAKTMNLRHNRSRRLRVLRTNHPTRV